MPRGGTELRDKSSNAAELRSRAFRIRQIAREFAADDEFRQRALEMAAEMDAITMREARA